jgi:membrane associated rhomboid family serine protease
MSPGVLQLSLVSKIPAWVWTLGVLAGVLLSVGLAIRLERPRGRWGHALRRRFVLGVPWGTLLTVAGVAGVYLFVQGGLDHPRNPIALPFHAWSYFYPLGMLAAPFSHAGLNHVTGNLQATLLFAPVAEYAWGHFPRARGSQSFATLRTNPVVRILAVPAAAVGVGVLTGLFSWGPVIGFSGVVFAFAGFGLASYPITTVLVLAGNQVLGLVVQSLQSPITVAQSRTVFSTPGWAQVAIQGHALGLLIGLLLGGYLAQRRDRLPDPGRLWFATLVFATFQSLWAVYVGLPGGRFVLFRGVGVVVVFLFAVATTAAVAAPRERTVLSTLSIPGTAREVVADLRTRELGVIVVAAALVAFGLVAVWTNLILLDPAVADGVTVDDYTVTYAEDVPHQYYAAFGLGLFGNATAGNTSGVIVASGERNFFWTAVPERELAFRGRATVVVGGPGDRRPVVANRTGWSPAGNDSVYTVTLRHGEDRRLAFTSPSKTARPRIAGRRVTVEATEDGFGLRVGNGSGSLGRTPIPSVGTNRSAGGLTFNRTADGGLFAVSDDTRVRIAGRN